MYSLCQFAKNIKNCYDGSEIHTHPHIHMHLSDFLALVDSLNGLTQPMVDALKELAPKLTDEQRAKAAADLQHASDDLLAAFETMQQHDATAATEVHSLEKGVRTEEESGERESDVAAAEAKLTDA